MSMSRWFHGIMQGRLKPGFDTTLLNITDLNCQEKTLVVINFGKLGSECKKYLERTHRINVRLTLHMQG